MCIATPPDAYLAVLIRMLADDSTAWPRPKAPVAGFAEFVCAGKNKSAPQRADLEEKGGRREGDVPAPLKVKLVGGTLHLFPRAVVGGKALGFTYSW